MKLNLRRSFVAAFLLIAFASTAAIQAQQIVQSRGVDSRVDYASLSKHGPWDDRNYNLNADDLAILPDSDAEHRVMVPAFYRVQIRKLLLDAGHGELLLYPRSSLPKFMTYYGGYLVDGTLYSAAERTETGFAVVMDSLSRTPVEFLLDRIGRGSTTEATVVDNAAESAVSINPVDPLIVVAGYNGSGGQRQKFSTDGGVTWNSGLGFLLPGSCCDPTFAWLSDGSVVYTATLDFSENDFYQSTDNGVTWTALDSIGSGGTDKEFLHADNYPGSPGQDNIYMAWHEGNVQAFSRYRDGAWDPKTTFTAEQRGIGSDLTTDKQGNIYYIYPAFVGATFGPGTIRLLKGTLGAGAGQPITFGTATVVDNTEDEFDWGVPAMDNRLVFQYVSADTDFSSGAFGNSLYASWTDNTGPESGVAANNGARIRVAFSRDQGASWTVLTPHNTADEDSVDRFHQWLKVGEDGKVHLIYYSTEFNTDGADGTNTRNSVDLAYQVSEDGGQTWSVPERLTTESSPDTSGGFEYGDYNGLDIVMNNLVGIYTDSREGYDVRSVKRTVTAGDGGVFADDFESGDVTAWN